MGSPSTPVSTTKSKADVIAAIREKIIDNGEYPDEVEVEGVELKEVDQEGGEGQGDNYMVVFEAKLNNETFNVMVTGSYSSYEGTDFSCGDVTEVESYQKTINAWREVK